MDKELLKYFKLQNLQTSLDLPNLPNISFDLGHFQDYLNYLSSKFREEEDKFQKDLDLLRGGGQTSVELTYDMVVKGNELKKFGTHFQNILYQSLLIAIVSYVEDVVVSLCKEVDAGYFSPEKGILYEAFKFLGNNKISTDSKYFLDVVKIRNVFVHSGGKVNKSNKNTIKKFNGITIQGDKIFLQKEFIDEVLSKSYELFLSLLNPLKESKGRKDKPSFLKALEFLEKNHKNKISLLDALNTANFNDTSDD